MNKKGQLLNMTNMLYLVVVGFVILQLASWVMTEFFDKEPIFVGPLIMGTILLAAVYLSVGVVTRFSIGGPATRIQTDARKLFFQVLIVVAILGLLYLYLPGLIPEFFEASMLSMLP